jgi:phosphatidylserine decarboxylase
LQVLGLFALGAVVAGGILLGLPEQPHLAWAGLVPVAVGLFVLSFYRDPERTGPSDPEIFLSPADGVVTDIIEVDEPHYLGGRALRVGIFLSPLNVHVNRVPVAGKVEKVHFKPGKCLPATGTNCIDENEAVLMGLATDAGIKIGLRQVTGALARSIVCGVSEGARLERGERYGMIKLGSRTELLVPVDAGFEPAVEIGQAVRGGETVLGRIPALAIASQAPREESA